jgi:hypothetical protein
MKKQTTQTCTKILIALAATMLISVTVQPNITFASSDTSFSVIWITDTQYLSENHPTYYDNLCNWIVQNKETYNLKMVVHTGDIVNDEGNLTQWSSANQSMSILLDNNIAYCWDAGNHDYNQTCWIGNQFAAFNPQIMHAKPYWLSDESGGMNTAVHLSVAGWDFLIVNIAFHANDTVLAWANNILDSNPQAHVIVATHAYLDDKGNYDSWATNLKNTVLETHANVFLTLSGHYHPTVGYTAKVGDRDELLFNQQDANQQTGAASARILTFDTAKGTIKVQTYDLNANQFLQDQNNNFTLNTTFHNGLAGKNVPEYPAAGVLLVTVAVTTFCLIYFAGKQKLKVLGC